jgi:hypothetical protein
LYIRKDWIEMVFGFNPLLYTIPVV